jgi:predicted metal-dependent phosphotriesterase family hydrolase
VLDTSRPRGSTPRLVWAHAHESTLEENLDLAGLGATISFDDISACDDAEAIERIAALTDAGFGDRVVVSTDTSVRINPPEMAYERSIDHLLGTFLPAVEARLGADVRGQLVGRNVARAVSLPPSVTDGERHGPGEG